MHTQVVDLIPQQSGSSRHGWQTGPIAVSLYSEPPPWNSAPSAPFEHQISQPSMQFYIHVNQNFDQMDYLYAFIFLLGLWGWFLLLRVSLTWVDHISDNSTTTTFNPEIIGNALKSIQDPISPASYNIAPWTRYMLLQCKRAYYGISAHPHLRLLYYYTIYI